MTAKTSKENQLTCPERHELDQLEAKIEKGIKTFAEVGAALMTIRNRRLYRQEHKSFDDYLLERWAFTRQYAANLIAAAEVVGNLSTIVDSPLPSNEAQARPLASLPPEQQREVWTEATANGNKPTAADVQAIIDRAKREMGTDRPRPEPTREEIEAEEAEELRMDRTATREEKFAAVLKTVAKLKRQMEDLRAPRPAFEGLALVLGWVNRRELFP